MQSFDQFFQPCQHQKRNMFNVCRDQQQKNQHKKSTTTKKQTFKAFKNRFYCRWQVVIVQLFRLIDLFRKYQILKAPK